MVTDDTYDLFNLKRIRQAPIRTGISRLLSRSNEHSDGRLRMDDEKR